MMISMTILKTKMRTKNINRKETGSFGRPELLLFHRKLRPMKQKRLRKDAQLAEMKLSLCEPLARGDCAVAQSFYVMKDRKEL